MSTLRSKVLQCYKLLHRTRKRVFQGDIQALEAGRQKINEEFRRNMEVTDTAKIEELVNMGHEADHYLKHMVVQAKFNEERDAYEVNLREETTLTDNYPFFTPYEGEVHKRKSTRKTRDRDSTKSQPS